MTDERREPEPEELERDSQPDEQPERRTRPREIVFGVEPGTIASDA